MGEIHNKKILIVLMSNTLGIGLRTDISSLSSYNLFCYKLY